MIIMPFKKEHFEELSRMPKQAFMKPILSTFGYADELEKQFSFSGLFNNRIVACAGLIPLWENNVRAWAITTTDIGGQSMLAVHRAVKRMLDVRTERRIEVEVDSNFDAGHRWIKMLGGFKWEGRMEKYTADGRDCDRYARVR